MSIRISWLGHAAFEVRNDDRVILIDPWLGNPKFPKDFKTDKVDAILITHGELHMQDCVVVVSRALNCPFIGHSDHVGDALQLSKKHNAKVYASHEVQQFLIKSGLSDSLVVGMNIGGTVDLGAGFKATMVNAIHSSDCGNGPELSAGGHSSGYVINTPLGHAIYHTGDTDVFGDMAIISDLWKPDVVLMCIGGHYTMGPRGAAYALDKFLTSAKIVIPMHYGTFPILSGTPNDLIGHLQRKDVVVARVNPGENIDLTGRDLKDAFHGLH